MPLDSTNALDFWGFKHCFLYSMLVEDVQLMCKSIPVFPQPLWIFWQRISLCSLSGVSLINGSVLIVADCAQFCLERIHFEAESHWLLEHSPPQNEWMWNTLQDLQSFLHVLHLMHKASTCTCVQLIWLMELWRTSPFSASNRLFRSSGKMSGLPGTVWTQCLLPLCLHRHLLLCSHWSDLLSPSPSSSSSSSRLSSTTSSCFSSADQSVGFSSESVLESVDGEYSLSPFSSRIFAFSFSTFPFHRSEEFPHGSDRLAHFAAYLHFRLGITAFRAPFLMHNLAFTFTPLGAFENLSRSTGRSLRRIACTCRLPPITWTALVRHCVQNLRGHSSNEKKGARIISSTDSLLLFHKIFCIKRKSTYYCIHISPFMIIHPQLLPVSVR